jgi:hypothetical protein
MVAKKESPSTASADVKLKADFQTALKVIKRGRRKPRKKNYKYEPSLISFLDVLGMKDLIDTAGADANMVARVLERLLSFSKPDNSQKDLWGSGFVNFSDLVVRSIPINAEANTKYRLGCVFHEMMDLAFIQVNLINIGILIRGALTIGMLCHTNKLVFGPGLVEAYRMESKVASYPRIIVGDDVIRALKEAPVLRAWGNSFTEEMGYLRGFLRRDRDKVWFLDYLAHIRSEANDHLEYGALLARHKEVIENQRKEVRLLDPADPMTKSRMSKLNWMIELHNNHLNENNPRIFSRETGFDLEEIRVVPTRSKA